MTAHEQTNRRGFLAAGIAALSAASLPRLTRGVDLERISRTDEILEHHGKPFDAKRPLAGHAHVEPRTAPSVVQQRANSRMAQGGKESASLSDAELPARQKLLDAIGYGSPLQTADIGTSVAKNALIGTLWAGARLLTQEVLNHCGVDSSQLTQHPSQKLYLETLRSKPIETLLMTCVAAPILEEVVFRALPSSLLDQRGEHGLSWSAGIPISLMFTLAHNIVPDKSKPLNLSFDASSISIPTFAAGLVFWYLQRTAGVDAAIVAHMANNCTLQAVQIAKMLNAATETEPLHSSK
jgi:membrane protease YdiL (CAAX protease family)